MAAVESAASARSRRGSEPSGCIMPAARATPISVPVLSKTTMKKNVSTTASIAVSSKAGRSIFRNTGAIDGGSEAMPANGARPNNSAAP